MMGDEQQVSAQPDGTASGARVRDQGHSSWSIGQALAVGAERDPERSSGGLFWLLGWLLACVYAMASLFHYGAEGYHSGFLAANQLFSRLPPEIWQWLTVLGDERVAFALSLFIARRHPRVFWTLVCASLVAIAYARGLKPLVDAARPPAVLPGGSFVLIGDAHHQHSFPSGHSVTAAVFFGVLIYYARRSSWRLLFLSLATLAGLSRIAVGVHWPLDVAAGLAGGVLAAMIGVWLARRSLWGIYDPGVHLAFVVLAGFAAVGLLLDDGGYPGAALMLQLIGAAALCWTLLSYLAFPLLAAVLAVLRSAARRLGVPLEVTEAKRPSQQAVPD